MMCVKNRRLTTLAAVPLAWMTLTALGSLPVMAAGNGPVADSSGGAGPLDRAQLGLAMVALGVLIFALTLIRLRMQSRRARAEAGRRSKWAKVTDTWAYSGMQSRRVPSHSRW